MNRNQVMIISLHADPASASGVGEGGGTHAYIRELMVGMTNRGWQVTVLTRWADPGLPELEVVSSNARIVRLRIGEVGLMDKRFLDDLNSESVTSALQATRALTNPDLIHSVYWNSGRVGKDLSEMLGIPFVHTVISNGWRREHHGFHDQPSSRFDVEREVFHAARAIFCISGEERRDLIEHYAVAPEKIVVVGRPVAAIFLRPCRDEFGRSPRHSWSDIGV